MKVVNKELGLLVDMSERQAQISIKRNPRKYTLPESVEEIELDEGSDEDVPKSGSGGVVKPPKEKEMVTVFELPEDPEPEAKKATIEEINASADASKGAIDLANKNGINLNDIGIEGRIMKTDVENYLNSK